jgi:hypothetical protein
MAYQSFFYDQQIRRYIIQFIRILSNLQVEFGKDRNGVTALQRVPVVYGDSSRQVASIIQNGSENYMNSLPAMAVYIGGFEYDRGRVMNPTYVDKLNLRERIYDQQTGEYGTTQGDTYTVERLMPVPYKLTLKVDVWTSNTEQKLQILEQLCTLFNPALEIQSTDNYVDWTSITYILLTGVNWSSKPVPTGTDSPQVETASLTFELPMFLSAPALVKKLGVIQKIVANLYDANGDINNAIYNEGNLLSRQYFTVLNYGIILLENRIKLVPTTNHVIDRLGEQIVKEVTEDIKNNVSVALTDTVGLEPGMFIRGLSITGAGNITTSIGSTIVNGIQTNFLSDLTPNVVLYHDGNRVGTVSSISSNTELILTANSLIDVTTSNTFTYTDHFTTYTGNVTISNISGDVVRSTGRITANIGDKIAFTSYPEQLGDDPQWRNVINVYGNLVNGSSRISVELDSGAEIVGTVAYNPYDATVLLWNPDLDTIPTNTLDPINAIIDPMSSRPNRDLQNLVEGTRYLLVNDYITAAGEQPIYNWMGVDNTPLIAYANDIIQYHGNHWIVAFKSDSEPTTQYVTNMTTGIQYKWDGSQWTKSYEGFYPAGKWQLIL